MTTHTHPLKAATAYLARGWQPIPIPSGAKGPTLAGWQKLRLTEADLPRYFSENGHHQNIGLLCGAPSGGLVDVDIDDDVAARLAGAWLPATALVGGRTQRPLTHYWYVIDPAPKTTRLLDPVTGSSIVELRSTGAQTIVAPSIHPDGDRYVWHERGQPAQSSAGTLLRAVRALAAVTLLAHYWPAAGGRHQLSLALAGWLLRGGLDPALAERIVRDAATAAGDEEAPARARDVWSTAARLDAGEPVTGAPHVSELLDQRVMRVITQWLGLRSTFGRGPVEDEDADWTALRCSSPPKMLISSGVSILGADEHLRRTSAVPRLVPLAAVRPQPVRWLWPGRVPLGKLTVLDGDPGLGKSLLTIDLAARVSRGTALPDGSRCDLSGPAGVVLLSAEDDPADTIRPRLDVAGGDPARVVVLQAVDDIEVTADGGEHRRERGVTLADIEALRRAIRETDARLVVIDPVMAHVGKADSHRDAEVRGLLRPLAELAAETGCAILIVRHLNKAGGGNPLYRGGGSIAWIGAARSGLLVAPDPDDETGQRRALAPNKTNLTSPAAAPTLLYTIEPAEHADAGVGSVPRVRWLGESAHTARSLLAQPVEDSERSAVEDAKAFLLGLLDRGAVEADRVRREARAAGIADCTLRRAKALLGVRSVRTGGLGETGHWSWSLPPRPPGEAAADAFPPLRVPNPAKSAMPEVVASLGEVGTLSGKRIVPPDDDPLRSSDLPFEGDEGVAEAEAEAWVLGDGDGEDVADVACVCSFMGCDGALFAYDADGGAWCARHDRQRAVIDLAERAGWPELALTPVQLTVGPGAAAWQAWVRQTDSIELDIARRLLTESGRKEGIGSV